MSRRKTRQTPNTKRSKGAATRSAKTREKAADTSASALEPSGATTGELPRLNLREFAALLGKSTYTISGWCDQGMPHEQPGKAQEGFVIRLESALPWVVQHALTPPTESQRERLAREQADKLALENALRRGELVDAGHVGIVLQRYAQTFWAQAKTIKKRCTHEFAGLTDPIRIGERFDEEFRNAGEALGGVTGNLAAACDRAAQDTATLDATTAAAA